MTSAAAAAAALSVTLSPAVAHPSASVHVEVSGLRAQSALVAFDGGIGRSGRWLGWVPVARRGGTWGVVLETPSVYGVYPLLLRAGDREYATAATLEVVPPGFAAQPGFQTVGQVARWWSWVASPNLLLRGVSNSQGGVYAHRDSTRNRLLRVTFKLMGDWPAQHLHRGVHTLYLNVARLRTGAPWRLLEVVREP